MTRFACRRIFKDGPSLFAQSFALRPVPQLMPNPRTSYTAREDPELGYGPELDRNDNYRPPVYHPTGQDSFAKRGGSVGYGGVYPIGNQGRGPRGPGGPGGPGGHGGPPDNSDPGYGYGDYNRPPPRGYNERASGGPEDGGSYDDSGDYGAEYEEDDEQSPPGGRQHHGGPGGSGSGYDSGSPNYDYGDPVQNGGYSFSGQNQEGDEHGKDSGNPYGPYDDSDNHIYGSGQSDSGREHGSGSGGDEFGFDSGSQHGSESGGGEGQYNSAGTHSEHSDNDSFENFDGFF